MKRIHITTGDLDGVGLEVSLKALKELGPVKGVQFILWRSNQAPKEMFNLIDDTFRRVIPSGFENSERKNLATHGKKQKCYEQLLPEEYNLSQQNNIENNKKENILLDISYGATPAEWVTKAARLCIKNPKREALVTGPLSKIQMQKEGFSERGHTDLLKKLSKTKYVFMTFLGEFFNVTLLTGHIPLKKIHWKKESLSRCIDLCLTLQNSLPARHRNKKVALLGLNPHAGEEGLLGKEEFSLKKELKKWKTTVEGPITPDVAFLKKNQKKYSIYICLYHDQALIPFKMIHERNSFQLSLGLPFIRTSVSHGTAKDIFGKNKADAQSMKQALLWAIHSLKKNDMQTKPFDSDIYQSCLNFPKLKA